VANVDPTPASAIDNNDDLESNVGRQPCAWWYSRSNNQFSSKDVTDLCEGFDDTISLVKEVFREQGPFDGILGFSQGACLTALICALKERGEFDHDFRFVILFAGFQSRSSPHRHLIETPLSNPSLHIIGETDNIISDAMSQSLVDQFKDPIVFKHSKGHMVPSSKATGRAVAEFLGNFKQIDSNEDK